MPEFLDNPALSVILEVGIRVGFFSSGAGVFPDSSFDSAFGKSVLSFPGGFLLDQAFDWFVLGFHDNGRGYASGWNG